jgi:L,D-transpeptidase ErfK/SrfK
MAREDKKVMTLHPLFKHITQLACVALSLSALSTTTFARTFNMPTANESIIGEVQYTSVTGDSVPTVAHRYNLGQNALIAANPGVVENGAIRSNSVTVPTRYMLPPLPRRGIVVNLSEMRMYYYPKGSNVVMTFPIGIGKIGKTIPLDSSAAITRKVVNPTWTPPEDIREFNREQGIELPKSMGPGPDNPLGPYAIYLSIPTYLIHSTIFPESIGRRASFGCIRMNEDDIKEFFPSVQAGTPVAIIDMPNKLAWQDNRLYLEAHPPLQERSTYTSLDSVVSSIEQNLPSNQVVIINWQLVSYITDQPDGLPHEVGIKVS